MKRFLALALLAGLTAGCDPQPADVPVETPAPVKSPGFKVGDRVKLVTGIWDAHGVIEETYDSWSGAYVVFVDNNRTPTRLRVDKALLVRE